MVTRNGPWKVDGSGCERQPEIRRKVRNELVWRGSAGYILLAISHGSISIKFITAFPANIARRSYIIISPPPLPIPPLLRTDDSFLLYFLLDPLYFPFFTRYYVSRPVYPASFRELFSTRVAVDLASRCSLPRAKWPPRLKSVSRRRSISLRKVSVTSFDVNWRRAEEEPVSLIDERLNQSTKDWASRTVTIGLRIFTVKILRKLRNNATRCANVRSKVDPKWSIRCNS